MEMTDGLNEICDGRRGSRIEAAVCSKEGHYSTEERTTILFSLLLTSALEHHSLPFSTAPLFPILCPPLPNPSLCRQLWVHISGRIFLCQGKLPNHVRPCRRQGLPLLEHTLIHAFNRLCWHPSALQQSHLDRLIVALDLVDLRVFV